MIKAGIAGALVAALAASFALAQEPQPGPRLPAMPSLEQKGADDMSKPAGALPPPPKAAASKPSPAKAAPGAKEPSVNKRAPVAKLSRRRAARAPTSHATRGRPAKHGGSSHAGHPGTHAAHRGRKR